MLNLGFQTERTCSGVSRREVLKVGALGFAGISLPQAVQAINASSTTRYRLSISMGVATNPPHKDIAALMQAADAAMYDAKRLRHQRRSLRVLTA